MSENSAKKSRITSQATITSALTKGFFPRVTAAHHFFCWKKLRVNRVHDAFFDENCASFWENPLVHTQLYDNH